MSDPKAVTILAILAANGITDKVALVGVRGYYADGSNQRGVYDDALVTVINGSVVFYRANTDPSVHRQRIALLQPGKYKYKTGIHGLSKPPGRRYSAFVQAGPVTVLRDGSGSDTGWFGINIHRGGVNSTSSLGCQTVRPAQWADFKVCLYEALDKYDQEVLPYLLVTKAQLDSAASIAATPVLPQVPPITYEIVGGTSPGRISQIRMVAGRGYAQVRWLASRLLGAEPEKVSFSWTYGASNDDDTLWLAGKAIEVIDVVEGVTWGSIADVADACGWKAAYDPEKSHVSITKVVS